MKSLSALIGLKKEALLFDSKLYIIKSIFAIATGYAVGKYLPLTRLDMISVLLGVMYNLEPINILGIKGGVSQLIASTLGAACTGILILFFGINVVTISVSMALTLYLSIKINWRMISPVAIFTCIYMTQYVQLDASGNPSVWLTYRLRIAALGLGVIIAILYNYLFSFLYYRRIAYKRLVFAKEKLINGLEYTLRHMEGKCENGDREYIVLFPSIFNDLDMVHSNISTMINETRYSFNLLHPEKLRNLERILKYFRDINHLAYDINFVICRKGKDSEFNKDGIDAIKEIIYILKKVDFTEKEHLPIYNNVHDEYKLSNTRVDSNITEIRYFTLQVLQEADAI